MKRIIELLQRLRKGLTNSLKLELPEPTPIVQSPPEIIEKQPEPDGDGWYKEPWGKRRPVKGFAGSTVDFVEDDPALNRGRIIVIDSSRRSDNW